MLCDEYPNINFAIFFKGLQISAESLSNHTYVVSNPTYLKAIDKCMKTFSVKKWAKWVKSCIFFSLLSILQGPFKKLYFEFFVNFLNGQKKPDNPDTEVFTICNDVCSDTLGKLYLESDITKFRKIRTGVTELKTQIIAAAKERVMKLNWLSEGSKIKAQYKLTVMGHRIAYPDVWFDEFKNVQIDKHTFLLNLLRLNKRANLWDISKLMGETSVMRKLWGNGCYDVNAYYFPEMNELCIPLGFLQKPFYSLEADFIENLAGVGNIIGHEIAHGFDEEGRKYDEHGNYFPWWTNVDIELYNSKTKYIISEFDKQKYMGLPINGTLTLGENLADLGAIAICMDVLYDRWINDKTPKETQLSELRKFFICYSKSWANKESKAKREMAVKNDPHAPAQLRVDIILRHCNEFYEAFGFTEKDECWIPPEERIDVWGSSKSNK